MNHWLLKVTAQTLLSRLPGGRWINAFAQHRLTGSTILSRIAFETRLHRLRKHFDEYARFSGGVPTDVAELGTGCFPVLAVGFRLLGVERVFALDIVDSLYSRTVRDTLLMFVDYAERGVLDGFIGPVDRDRCRELKTALEILTRRSPREALDRLNIKVLIGPAYSTGLEPKSVDLFYSNDTLEHIQSAEILRIFGEFNRLAKPGALMSHSADLQDHYATFDHRLTPFHFYRYTTPAWRRYNPPLHFVNRLRPVDYRRLLERSGWRIVGCQVRRGDPTQLRDTPLATEFRRYTIDDLLAISCHLLSVAT